LTKQPVLALGQARAVAGHFAKEPELTAESGRAVGDRVSDPVFERRVQLVVPLS
jgi:hypothetical protein